MLTLYYSEKSCSFAPHILLYDTGTNFVSKRTDFDTGEQSSLDYLSINPKGRVPALMTPDGILTGNPEFLLYFAQMYPEKKLAPKEPFALAKASRMSLSIMPHVISRGTGFTKIQVWSTRNFLSFKKFNHHFQFKLL